MTEQTETAAESSQQTEATSAETQQGSEGQPEQTQADTFAKEKAGLQEALVAERRKRQDAESYTRIIQQQYQASQTRAPEPKEEEDEYTRDLKRDTKQQIHAGIKQSVENQFIQSNPQLLEQDSVTGRTWLEEKLEPILRKKPYLAQVIKQSENRYARAMEIIDDYTPKDLGNDTRKRLEENAQKPGSPAGVAKSGNLSKLAQINKMSRREFSEYRAGIRGKAPNIR